jgi:succinate dehydrogenase/fumarate reductase flavoprotein subunit
MGKRKKSAFRNKEERDAWEAHVDETIARMRGLAEKAWAEIQEKKRASGASSPARTEP